MQRRIAQDRALPRRRVALSGTPFRATAREHTADVPGETRGRIERSFIHGKEPWDVNLLSATPTLEMGIDIGDLSSVLLGSMPRRKRAISSESAAPVVATAMPLP